MRDWVSFVTLLAVTIMVLFIILNLYGCSTFEIMKESAKAAKIISVVDKKTKKEEKTNEEKKKENIIACIKLQPECDKNEK